MSKVRSDAPRFTKIHLPERLCARCGRVMTWRRKWARDWDRVKYCSERCRRGS